jgi:hypothetical protein
MQQVTEGVSREATLNLIGCHGTVTHNTTRTYIRSLQPQEIVDWLKIPTLIKGVATQAGRRFYFFDRHYTISNVVYRSCMLFCSRH